MGIYEKLSNVQASLKAPKGQYNSFGKYHYRSCEDIVESVKPLLKQNGLLLTLSDEIINIADRFYVRATATVIDTTDGKSISVSAFAREEKDKKGMDGSQVTGASSSYARKYALNGLFAIDDTKDSDATNTEDNKPKETPKEEYKLPKGKTPRQALIERLTELGEDITDFSNKHNLKGCKDDAVFMRLLKELS